MPLFAMISSCNMLFDSSKHCNLMLFSAKSETDITCNLTMCVWACSSDFWRYLSVHVLLCFTSTSCPCLLLLCWDAVAYCFDASNMPSCCFRQIVAITCIVCECWTVAPFWVCSIWNLLSFTCSFILSFCIHVLRCLLDVWMHFASIPCLTCFPHIF